MGFILRDYQQKLVDESREEIRKGNKNILIQSPPGSGKSVVIADIARTTIERGGHVMFVVHRKELIEQIKGTFEAHGVDMEHTTIETVIKTRNRLGQYPYPTLIITDESHHARAKTYQEIYDYYPKAFHLGFTATPWRLNGKGFEDIYDVIVRGKSVQWLIDNQALAPYRYFSVKLADSDKLKKSSTGDYTKKSMDKAVTRKVFGDVVKNYQKLAEGKQAILYAHSVEASKMLAEEFNESGIQATHADAKTPRAEREKIMNDFRSGTTKVLCNVDLISEGFDVPDCSCVIMVRPTASLVLYLQQSMRCMRYQPGKEAIIIDHVANYEDHGLPNTEREWSLRSWKKKGEPRTDNTPEITQCPHCYGVFYSASLKDNKNHCPLCNEEIVIEQNYELEHVEAELEEISMTTDYSNIIRFDKRLDELETVEDYYLFAKTRGHKVGWVKFNAPKFRNVPWWAFYQEIKPLQRKYNDL